MKNWILLTITLFIGSFVTGQELNPTVKINAQQIQLVDPAVFVTLEKSITEFLLQQWSDDAFELEERIDCNFIFNLTKEVSATSFEMTLAIQSSRPIFGTDNSTPILNATDGYVKFDYEQHQPLQFSETRFDNLRPPSGMCVRCWHTG